MEGTCCFTGHRPDSFNFPESSMQCIMLKERLRIEINNMIAVNGVRHFISGMAMGVDTWAAEVVLEFKERLDITLEAAIPCRTQSKSWKKADKERYNRILELCDTVTVLNEKHIPNCMMERNKYMVDNSDYVLAVWNGKDKSGTGRTIKYARKKEKKVMIIKA